MPRRAAALHLLAGLALASCGPHGRSGAVVSQSANGSSLWEVTVDDPAGRPQGTVWICADQRIQAAFARPSPEVGDRSCGATQVRQERPDAYSATCRISDQPFSVNAIVRGDRSRDMTVEITVQPLPSGPAFQQVRRYRKIADTCPVGWTAGDASAPLRPGPYSSAPGEASNPVVPGIGSPGPGSQGRP